MSAGDRPDLPPRKCATCGCEVRGWFSTAAEVAQGIVYCRAHSTPLGMWSKEANGGAIEAVESVQGPDTAPEGANGSMDAPSDEDELRQMAEACRFCEKCDRCLVCEPDIDPFLGHMNTCGIPCGGTNCVGGE